MVYADVGLDATGRINWAAPVMRKYGIQGIPYFVVIDERGTMSAQGKKAREAIGAWMTE